MSRRKPSTAAPKRERPRPIVRVTLKGHKDSAAARWLAELMASLLR